MSNTAIIITAWVIVGLVVGASLVWWLVDRVRDSQTRKQHEKNIKAERAARDAIDAIEVTEAEGLEANHEAAIKARKKRASDLIASVHLDDRAYPVPGDDEPN